MPCWRYCQATRTVYSAVEGKEALVLLNKPIKGVPLFDRVLYPSVYMHLRLGVSIFNDRPINY
jgi:hypothetical protein